MEDPSKGPMHRLNLLNSEIDATYHEATLKLGLTDSAMIVLYTLCMLGGSGLLSRIIALSGLSKQTINSALRGLEAQGVLFLQADSGRRKKVCLTEKGQELAGRTALRLIQMENEIFAAWSQEDREAYIHMTQRFLTALREKVKEL